MVYTLEVVRPKILCRTSRPVVFLPPEAGASKAERLEMRQRIDYLIALCEQQNEDGDPDLPVSRELALACQYCGCDIPADCTGSLLHSALMDAEEIWLRLPTRDIDTLLPRRNRRLGLAPIRAAE